MKLIGNAKKLFRRGKHRSASRSASGSFALPYSMSSSSSDSPEISLSYTMSSGCQKASERRSTTPAARRDCSDDGYRELLRVFTLLDKDGEGRVPMKEAMSQLTIAGDDPPTPTELMMMLKEVGGDDDGWIGLDEFCAISSAFGPPPCESELCDAFRVFDVDGDGRISAEELHRVLSSVGVEGLSLEDCRAMIRGRDKNGDGFVCLEDFTHMMVLTT